MCLSFVTTFFGILSSLIRVKGQAIFPRHKWRQWKTNDLALYVDSFDFIIIWIHDVLLIISLMYGIPFGVDHLEVRVRFFIAHRFLLIPQFLFKVFYWPERSSYLALTLIRSALAHVKLWILLISIIDVLLEFGRKDVLELLSVHPHKRLFVFHLINS